MGYRPHVSNDKKTLRASAGLTTSYVASDHIQMKGWNAAVIEFDFTLNVSTSAEIKIEIANPLGDAAPVAGDWYGLSGVDEQATTATGVVSHASGVVERQFAASGKYAILLPHIAAKFLRVQVKVTAGPGTSSGAVYCAQALV
jgi:hypothetical protein